MYDLQPRDAPMAKYERVLLKLSGELLSDDEQPLSGARMAAAAASLKAAHDLGVQIAVVVGGGNLIRGRDHAHDLNRPEVDQVGMLATVLNVGLLQLHLERAGLDVRVMTPRAIEPVSERFARRDAIAALESGAVVLLGGGTGNPFFSTDSAAALRAIELRCDALLKGTMVDGVYDKDPNKHQGAVRFDTVSFDEVIRRDLKVMDQAAIALCRDNAMPVVVFEMKSTDNLVEFLEGRVQGTVVEA